MVVPSANGSEKGTPNSMTSAPFLSISKTSSKVVSKSGSPAVIKGIRAFLLLLFKSQNLLSILFIASFLFLTLPFRRTPDAELRPENGVSSIFDSLEIVK